MDASTQGYVDSDYLSKAGDLFLPLKQKSYNLLGDLAGKQVLDIGCGPGLDSCAMAQLVGLTGTVTGVDVDPDMICQADQLAAQQQLTQRVKHQLAQAHQLPFAENSFDAVRSERLFMHLTDPQAVFAEALRVARPGGRVVIIDTDWGSLSTHTGMDDLERRLVSFRAETFLPNGYSGRNLFGMFNQQGLEAIEVESHTFVTTDLPLWQLLVQDEQVVAAAQQQGVISAADVQRWQQALSQAAAEKQFFASVHFFLVAATVPS